MKIFMVVFLKYSEQRCIIACGMQVSYALHCMQRCSMMATKLARSIMSSLDLTGFSHWFQWKYVSNTYGSFLEHLLILFLEKFFDGSWKHDNQECVHGMLWEEFSLHGSHLVMMLKLGAYMHVKIICMVLMHSKCMLRILTCIVLFHAKVHSQWGLHR